MSYQVIARKFRPQTFSDLTGQEHITRTLSNALDLGRIHHAYLFSGVRGTGKTTTARILAKGLNCRIGMTSQPCLQCASCLEIAAGNSIDVLEIDAASNTGVDNVRDVIINNIATAPARDRYKIFVIDEIHMLSTSAFNALLKTLEEPPAHVVFIMATTELHKVPDTILSRCQPFEFRQIPTEKIFLRLREIAKIEGIEITDPALREIARAGAGSMRDAQSAFDQVIAFSGAEINDDDVSSVLGLVNTATLGQFTEAIAKQDTSKVLNLVDEVFSRGYDLRNFTRELMAYLRHLLVVKSGIFNSEILGVSDIEIDQLKQLASKFSEEDLVRFFHLLAQTEKEIKDSALPRFQLEIGLVKLTQTIHLRPLNDIIERLELLESKLSDRTATASGGVTLPPQPSSGSGKQDIGSATEPPEMPEFDLSDPPDLSDPIETAPVISRPAINIHNTGSEVEEILRELKRLNRGLIQTALEDAANIEFGGGLLVVTFSDEGIFARRLRESGALFREIGERLFGRPLLVEVKVNAQPEERIDEAELKRKQLRERAMQNPAVRLLLEQTGGEIVSIKEEKS